MNVRRKRLMNYLLMFLMVSAISHSLDASTGSGHDDDDDGTYELNSEFPDITYGDYHDQSNKEENNHTNKEEFYQPSDAPGNFTKILDHNITTTAKNLLSTAASVDPAMTGITLKSTSITTSVTAIFATTTTSISTTTTTTVTKGSSSDGINATTNDDGDERDSEEIGSPSSTATTTTVITSTTISATSNESVSGGYGAINSDKTENGGKAGLTALNVVVTLIVIGLLICAVVCLVYFLKKRSLMTFSWKVRTETPAAVDLATLEDGKAGKDKNDGMGSAEKTEENKEVRKDGVEVVKVDETKADETTVTVKIENESNDLSDLLKQDLKDAKGTKSEIDDKVEKTIKDSDVKISISAIGPDLNKDHKEENKVIEQKEVVKEISAPVDKQEIKENIPLVVAEEVKESVPAVDKPKIGQDENVEGSDSKDLAGTDGATGSTMLT